MDMNIAIGGSIVDVDFVRRSSLEKAMVHSEAGDWQWWTGFERGGGSMRDGEV